MSTTHPTYDPGTTAWLLTSTALVLLMIPGIGFFYSGLARRKSALSLLLFSLMSAAVVGVQWFFWGYSLTYSHSAGAFIGDLANIGMRNVGAEPSAGSAQVPDLLLAVYGGGFAAVTVALLLGAVSERGRTLPALIFMFLWSTVVYDVIACWTWNPLGWAYKLGGLDFAGGAPVHIASGSGALAYSYILGKRSGFGTQKLNYRPHSVVSIVLGTMFLWIGWLGFNGGSALSADLRAVMAVLVTNVAAAMGGVTWCLVDYRLERKWTVVGFCSGVIAGLVAITPASGYVPPWAAVVFGICAGLGCNFATQIKYWIGADDALDVFAVHGVGGALGNILTGIFAADYIAGLDGATEIPGGWLNRHWMQVPIQIATSASAMGYSFVVTAALLALMGLIGRFVPALKLRVDEGEEEAGMDEVETGEFAYDYVELTREAKPVVDGRARSVDCVDEMYSQRTASQTNMMAADKDGYPLRTLDPR